jgi:uncharacterized heparinase superfamily protein
MMRVSVAERTRLSVFVGRRAFRSLIARFNAHPFTRWRYGSTSADRLLIAPQDLRTADATRAAEIYAGRFAFAGKVVICDRRSVFELTPPSDEWAVVLLSLADRRVDQPARRLASARLAARHSVAPARLLAQPGALRPAGGRCALLPPLHPQPVATVAILASLAQRFA